MTPGSVTPGPAPVTGGLAPEVALAGGICVRLDLFTVRCAAVMYYNIDNPWRSQ